MFFIGSMTIDQHLVVMGDYVRLLVKPMYFSILSYIAGTEYYSTHNTQVCTGCSQESLLLDNSFCSTYFRS